MKNLYIFLPLILSLLSCNFESPLDRIPPHIEEFRECEEMPIRNDSLIRTTLPGRWELVAIYTVIDVSNRARNLTLEFEEDLNLRIVDGEIISEYQMTVIDGQLLTADSLQSISTVSHIDVFCEQYMGFDDTPRDGTWYIFEKS